MLFTKRLHEPIRNGEVTCSIRIWKRPRVTPGKSYTLGTGRVVVDKLFHIELEDITPSLARKSGFSGVADLLKVARHGTGENVYLIEFHYESQPAIPGGPCERP